jgi:hypothetical protein
MQNITIWYDEVLPDFVNMQPEFALHHIRLAVIDFCEETLLLRQEVGATYINNSTYGFISTQDRTVVEVMRVYLSGKKLDSTEEVVLSQRYPTDWRKVLGTTNAFIQLSPDNLVLVPNPNANVSSLLDITAAVKPTRSIAQIDDVITDNYYDEIVHGAKARLFEIPSKPWTDSNLAAYHKAKFAEMCSTVKSDVLRGFARGSRRVRTHNSI